MLAFFKKVTCFGWLCALWDWLKERSTFKKEKTEAVIDQTTAA